MTFHRLSIPFRLHAPFPPKGDQPKAIEELLKGFRENHREQVLLGVTGSGKTFTVAHVIAELKKPTLVLSPNKTLAAQLYQEYREFFPENAVHYFVSYYDYYQPEAYIPETDTYIEKDTAINEEIDKLRHGATQAVLERTDVIVVASVSCIYGIGSPEAYYGMLLPLTVGEIYPREKVIKKLVQILYERNDYDFYRGTFRVRGEKIEIFPIHEEDRAVRVEFFGDEIERLTLFDPLSGKTIQEIRRYSVYPASHWVTDRDRLKSAIESIREELRERLQELRSQNKLLEAQRLEQRTLYDIEMLQEMGWCPGIENYSRHLSGRKPGEPPYTLLDYFPRDFLLVVDESHITLPQVKGMYRGDRSRKETLVEHGFRLPSALDNRPLTYEEFRERLSWVLYVSATPAEEEIALSKGRIVEQIIRPTGLLDPIVDIRPASTQVDDLTGEVERFVKKGYRVLVTTLTKRMAEDLAEFLTEKGFRVKYLHSEIDTLDRVEILQDLRKGVFDVLVGINLLREGLDLPEVGLVAILDADKEGFLRSERSLIQIMGRAARNAEGMVILYADTVTPAIKKAVEESRRRRKIQEEYNQKHGIVPKTVEKALRPGLIEREEEVTLEVREEPIVFQSSEEVEREIQKLEKEMKEYAKKLEFEKAAQIRDRIKELKRFLVGI